MTAPFNTAYQFPQHRVSVSDNPRWGNAVSSAGQLNGVSMALLQCENMGAPAAAGATTVLTATAIAGATPVLAPNAIPTGGTLVAGVATVDFPRNLVYVSSNAGDSTQTVTITGTDYYGAPMTELITLTGTGSVAGKKAFYTISNIAVSAALAGNLSVGTGGKLGLSYKIAQGGFIQGKLDPNTADAGTVVMPDQTSPATSSTGDVRGTYAPAGALNGTNNYHVTYVALGGPNNSDGFGQTQA